MMNILFIADDMATFKVYKDTTYVMMREAAKRGHRLFHCFSQDLHIANGLVQTQARAFDFLGAKDDHDHAWFDLQAAQTVALKDFSAVIMRTDPPFNMQYLYATQLLTLAAEQGTSVLNSGQAMRDFNEKLAILNFSQFTTPTLVTTSDTQVREFLAEHGDIIVKPLDGMGGMGIFRLRPDDANIGSILETLMLNNTRTIMAQRYIPEIVHGDKRVLVINGKPLPYALARIPQNGETRGNLAAGGKGVAQDMSARDMEIAETLAPELMRRGIVLAGLDIIGDCLTEVNVTSPTGFQEIMKQKGLDVAALFIDAVEEHAV
ncbi:MAG: glutathione synthase [Vitreoscilla sp.]|nr:glutathione synthase [Vitreoscilla sp.]